jgi:UDP-glucose 4-epimerase
MKNILITGGAGYIGSHVVVELASAGFRPIVLDNFNNSDEAALKRLEKLVGKPVTFYEAAYQDAAVLKKAIEQESIDGIIHIVGYKAVGESVENPLKYYRNNVAGFVGLLEMVLACNVNNFVFSSSAAVYGNPPTSEVTETAPCNPENPYGWSKRMDEIMLRDTCRAHPDLRGIALRYFNVVGSHDSAIIGESPKSILTNLLPIIVQAVATDTPLTVYGDDYDTPDGTCLRDYIHVIDLARAHVAALQKSFDEPAGSYEVYNIGTGRPTSVMELITTFERVNKVKVPYKIGARRAGDPVSYYAIAEKANHKLGWHATQTIEDAVRSAWRWQQSR